MLIGIQSASAALLVAPIRVAFDERDRTKEVILINEGDERRTYRVEWQEQTVDAAGGYVALDEAAEFNRASSMIRYSPRQVTLEPGERQIIKLVVRKPADLKQGEYRSHLKFTAIPTGLEASQDPAGPGIGIKMHLFMSYTIPVIVKQGSQEPSVMIGNTSLRENDGRYFLQTELYKDSIFGVSGDLVALQAQANGEQKEVARLNNVNFFHELNQRTAKLVLLAPEQALSGSLTLRYEGKYEFLGKVLSEKSIVIQ